MEAYDELSNLTMTAYWPQKARVISRFPSYLMNCVLIICTLWWILHIYYNLAKENDKIRRWFTGNTNDIEMGITAIRSYSENMLMRKKNHSLKNANFFASIYVCCCLCWSVAYAYEVIRTQQTITRGLILNSVAHLFSYGSLVIIMWLTNKTVDKMKKTALQKINFEYQRTNVDLVSFKMLIKFYNPYALLLTKKTNVPDIFKAVLSGFVSLMSPFIKSHLPW